LPEWKYADRFGYCIRAPVAGYSENAQSMSIAAIFPMLRKLCISHPDLAEHEKSKMRFCFFIHFSIAYAIEKWRHIPVPQESLPFAEIP